MGILAYMALGRIGKRKATVYRKCKEMPLHNYMEYLETGDLKWFTKEHVDVSGLIAAMTDFYGELMEITGDYKIIGRFSKLHKVMKLKGKYDAVSLLIASIYNYRPEMGAEKLDELVAQLEKWNYRIQKDKDLIEQANKIHTRLQGLITQIELIEKEINADDIGEKLDMAEQILNITLILQLPYRIDPQQTSVYEWVTLQNQAKKVIEHGKRNRHSSIQKGTGRP